MTTARLPASTELLGLFVKALDAKRYAEGSKACALRDRTSRRGFAGRARTVHWCCRLTGLLDFLVQEGLASPLPEGGAFLPLAAAMLRWDAVARTSEHPARAHFRVAAIELGAILRLLGPAVDEQNGAEPPSWLDPARRAAPLRELRLAAMSPPLSLLARQLKYGEHALGRWFTKAERPGREALQVLARRFAYGGEPARKALYRKLYWHYALGDVVTGLCRWLPEDEAREIASVASAIARCKPQLDAIPPAVRRVAPLLPAIRAQIDHAIEHGAGVDWRVDAEQVLASYRAAGIGETEDGRAHSEFILRGLPKRSRRGGG